MTTAAANSTTTGTLPANLLLRVLGDSIVTISRGGVVIATQSTARDNFVGPYPDEVTYSVVAGGSAVNIDLVNSERALVADTQLPLYAVKDANGNTTGNAEADGSLLKTMGFAPKTNDYTGVYDALMLAASSSTMRAVVFDDTTYDLGNNYIPIISGVEYIGVPPRMNFTNGAWLDKDVHLVGGTKFTTSHDYVFWDGAIEQDTVTSTVAAQSTTFTLGSSLIGVEDGGLFTLGGRVYVENNEGGFFKGLSYFVVSLSGNNIELGHADKLPIVATSSATIASNLSAGNPNDISSRVVMRDLGSDSCKTFIKAGAGNTFSFVHSDIRNIYANGTLGHRVIDIINYAQSTFERIITADGDGQYWGNDIEWAVYLPGNSELNHLFNANNASGVSGLTSHGIVFEALDGSTLNEVHARHLQNNNQYISVVSQACSSMTSGNPLITVTDNSKFPVGMPVWVSTAGDPNGYKSGAIYFVTFNTAANKIALSKRKGGNDAITSPSLITIGSPTVINWPNNGMSAGTSFVFETSGNLPTGVDANTVYYVISAGLSTNTFQFSATAGGSAVVTSGVQSGRQKIRKLSNSTGSSAMTLNTRGYPGLEVVGTGNGFASTTQTGGKITTSSFKELDLEGNSSCGLLLQNVGGIVSLHEIETSNQCCIGGGNFTGLIENPVSGVKTDLTGAGYYSFSGIRSGASAPLSYEQWSGSGVWYDQALAMSVLSLHNYTGQQFADLQGVSTPSAGTFVKSFQPITVKQSTQDTSRAFGNFDIGQYIFNGAIGQTFTLPTITNTAPPGVTMVGAAWEFVNASANALTVATDGTQTFNNQAAKTSFTLAAGTKVRCTGALTAGGTLFWMTDLCPALP